MKNKWPYPRTWNIYDRLSHSFVWFVLGIMVVKFMKW